MGHRQFRLGRQDSGLYGLPCSLWIFSHSDISLSTIFLPSLLNVLAVTHLKELVYCTGTGQRAGKLWFEFQQHYSSLSHICKNVVKIHTHVPVIVAKLENLQCPVWSALSSTIQQISGPFPFKEACPESVLHAWIDQHRWERDGGS